MQRSKLKVANETARKVVAAMNRYDRTDGIDALITMLEKEFFNMTFDGLIRLQNTALSLSVPPIQI